MPTRSCGILAGGRNRRTSRPDGKLAGRRRDDLKKQKMTYVIIGAGILLVLVVLVLAQGSLRHSGGIVLPMEQTDTEGTGNGNGSEGLDIVQITPDTVQPAINTLSRPATYSRTQTVETFWSGGSGTSVSMVSVSAGRTRVDTQLPDGSMRHMLIVGSSAAVWYDDETTWTVLTAEQFNADVAQRMLTYETVRDLPVSDIAEANYQDLEGVSCIYVSTRTDEAGYSSSYWVNVSNGLLKQAERYCDGELVYRFTAEDTNLEAPAEELFLLPDGSVWEVSE